jgi:hypothetical protein
MENYQDQFYNPYFVPYIYICLLYRSLPAINVHLFIYYYYYSNKCSELGTIGKSPGVHRLSASLHDLSIAVNEEGAAAPNGPDYDQYSPSGASTMGRRSAFGNGGVKKSHAALCKSVSQVSSTDSTRTEEEDDTTTVSSSSGGSSGSLATALQTEIRRRAAEKSTPGTFRHVFGVLLYASLF